MVPGNIEVSIPVLLVLLLFTPSHAIENSILISLDAVSKPFNECTLSYPKQAIEKFTRGIQYLTDSTDDGDNKSGQKQYLSFPTYRTKLSINSNTDINKLSEVNTTGGMKEELKSVTALVDITSPFVWMQGGNKLSLASDYAMNSSCQSSEFPRGSGASHVADFIFPQSGANIKFLYDEPKRNDGSDGILAVFGLSNNPCSLLKQLGYSKFSYCLAPNSTESSAILLGSDFRLRKRKRHEQQPAQLVQNDNFPFSYSVNLEGISVGYTEIPGTALPNQGNGPATMILDSVTPVTLLKREVYESIKREFLSQMNQLNAVNVTSSSLGLELCFSNPTFWPQLTLKFFPAATMFLSNENYVVRDINTGMECLAIAPSQDVSVMGTMMQQNHLMTFDIERSTLSFEQANCGGLSVSSATDLLVPHGVTLMHNASLIAALFVIMLLMG